MFTHKTSLSLLLFFMYIITFTIRKVNPYCEKQASVNAAVRSRPSAVRKIVHRRSFVLHRIGAYSAIVGVSIPAAPTTHAKRKEALDFSSASLFSLISGFLSSQGASPQVLSAFAGLTAVFAMGTGGSPQLSPLNYLVSGFVS